MWGQGKRIITIVAAILLVIPVLSDFVIWSRWRQQLQGKADSAAMAGAKALRRGEPVVPAVRARLARVNFTDPPQIEVPPRTGAYSGRDDAVRVSLSAVRSPFFHSRLFGASRMHARATAALVSYRGGGENVLRVE
jgi:hypothetical protein